MRQASATKQATTVCAYSVSLANNAWSSVLEAFLMRAVSAWPVKSRSETTMFSPSNTMLPSSSASSAAHKRKVYHGAHHHPTHPTTIPRHRRTN